MKKYSGVINWLLSIIVFAAIVLVIYFFAGFAGIALLTLGLIILTALLILAYKKLTKPMTVSDTASVNKSVWCIKDLFVNAYLFKSDNGYVLVDAGFSVFNFRKQFERLGISPDLVKALLLTHTDVDHSGAKKLFKNAEIYMHREEEQMINGINSKHRLHKTIWRDISYHLLDNNQSIVIDGLEIKILHTPGHTPGSSCFIISNEYLVTGDNVILKAGRYEHFLSRTNMDTRVQEESIKILPDPSLFSYILTAHTGIVEMVH